MTSQQAGGRHDLGIASALLGAGSVAAALLLDQWMAGVALGAAAILFALGTVLLPGRSRGGSVVGLILGILGVGLAVGVALSDSANTDATSGAELPAEVESAESTSSVDVIPEPTIPDDVRVLSYRVETDGLSATHLSYVDYVDGELTMVDKLGVPAPFEYDVFIPNSASLDIKDFSVTSMGGNSSTVTRCTITLDGKPIASQIAEGAYALVNCVPEE